MKDKEVKECQWLFEYEGICTNPYCDHCADFVNEEDCEKCKHREY